MILDISLFPLYHSVVQGQDKYVILAISTGIRGAVIIECLTRQRINLPGKARCETSRLFSRRSGERAFLVA